MIDREYVKRRTTLSEETQLKIEEKLLQIGIMQKQDKEGKSISLDITVLTSILMSPDEALLKDIKKIAKVPTSSKATKTDNIKKALKENIVTTNEELVQAYSDWIDSVLEKDGWMSKKAVICAQNVVDQNSDRNLDVALKILEIATINGYRDMTWAVNNFKKDYKIPFVVSQQTQKKNDSFMSTPPMVSADIF